MRNKHIGDSLDLAKKEVLQLLATMGYQTLVAPLPCQRNFEFDLYSRVLGVPEGAIFGQDTIRYSGRKREEHLKALRQALTRKEGHAVLLDPDSGLSSYPRGNPKYLGVDELHRVIDQWKGTWLVYHHQSTGRMNYDEAAAAVGASFYYNFGKAALIAGGTEDRLCLFKAELKQKLNPGRVHEL